MDYTLALNALEEIGKAATAGPWVSEPDQSEGDWPACEFFSAIFAEQTDDDGTYVALMPGRPTYSETTGPATAEFITTARNVWAALIDLARAGLEHRLHPSDSTCGWVKRADFALRDIVLCAREPAKGESDG